MTESEAWRCDECGRMAVSYVVNETRHINCYFCGDSLRIEETRASEFDREDYE